MATDYAQVYTGIDPTSMLPTVYATIAHQQSGQFYIDNNRADSYVFTDNCVYSNSLGPATNCTDAPVLAKIMNTLPVDPDAPVFNNQNAGGYTGVTGTLNYQELSLFDLVDGQVNLNQNTNYTVYTEQLWITNVTYDNWLYDLSAEHGAIGLGPGSGFMWQLNSNTTLPANSTVWSLEIGSVVDQTFSGAQYDPTWNPAMYIGQNLSTVFNATNVTGEQINLNSDGSKFFNLYGGAFFGKYIDLLPHFAQLTMQSVDINQNVQPPNVIFAANMQGIQLPYSLYQQWVGLMTRISSTITTDFHCNTRSGSFQNNFCYLAQSCNSTDYTSLWDYQFNFEFASLKPTMFVGLGSLAWDQNGVCMLGVTGSETYNNIAIGAFAMQNFNFLFNGLDNNNFAVNIIQSNWTNPMSSIDFKYVNNTNAAPAFTYVQNLTLEFMPTADGQAYTYATLGPYADQQYLVSLNNSATFVYSQGCSQDVALSVRSCSLEPLNAHPTWNLANNLPTNTTLISQVDYDGYTLSGYQTQNTLCFQAQPSDNLIYGFSQCSLSNTTTFYIVDRVDGVDDWNRWRSSYAGIIGLDNASPIWDVVFGSSSLLAGVTKTYEIDYESGTLVLGAYNQTKFNQTANMTVNAVSSSSGNMYRLSEFSFGQIYQEQSTAYFSSLLNDDVSTYGDNANMTLITLDTSSLILPYPLYYKFLNLLAIITKGAANCDYNNAAAVGGICILPGKCSDWESDIGNFTFQIAFADAENTSQYLILPLSTWMFTNQFYLKNYFPTDADFCYIDVQTQYAGNLAANLSSQPIVFGLGFFKYVNMLRQSSSSINQMTLALNDNGVTAGAMIAQYFYTQGTNPFVVTPYSFSTAGVNNGNGMPMLFVDVAPGLTKNGVNDFTSMFYYDLESNAQTFIFNQTCTQKITGVELNCTQAPVNAVSQNFSNMGEIETQASELHISGYDLRGSYLIQQLTFHPSASLSLSTVQSVFAVNQTLANYWLYDQTALYGQIALGPNSPFTYQFIDPESLFQEYSIGNATLYFGGYSQFSSLQNGTVFMTGDLVTPQTYDYQHVMFGKIYLQNNTPSESYFSQLDTTNANLGVVFLQNFPGIGLPTPLYSNFNALMSNLSDNSGFSYSCNTTVGSVCTVYESCAHLTTHFQDYAFQFTFSKLNGVNVLTVPMTNFISDNGDSCNLGVYYLDYQQNTQSNNVIIGARFWQTFEANVTNSYDVATYTFKSQQIAISASADSVLSYAGQNALPNTGRNPFAPGPHQYQCEINPKTFMPELMASFNSTDYQTYLIDNNAKKSLIWTTSCLQAMNSDGTVDSCSNAPTYVNEWYNLNQSFIAPNVYLAAEQGGYITDGNEVTAPMVIPLFNDGVNNDTLNITVRAVTDITEDVWQFNMQGQPSGQFALGWNSDWVMAQANSKNQSVWGISFTSSSASNQQCQIYVGDGTYGQLYNNQSTQLYAQNTTDNTYSLYSMWFGYNNSESINATNYFLPLGYNGAPQKAIIALNYQGLGLPSYYWWQFANLLSRVSHIVQNDLFIDNDTGLFYLNGHCKNTDYDDLWHYFISVEMFQSYGGATGNKTEYVQVPLASFAQYNSSLDACMLYIQLLNSHEGLPQTDKVILGSMFLQNFQMLYVTDYSVTPAASGVAMDVSFFGQTVLASIGNLNYTQDASPAFDYAVQKELPLSCSTQSMLCTLQADLGFQGFDTDMSTQNYLVSFTDSWLYALDRNCKDETTASFRRCSSGQYFNTDSSYGAPVGDIYTTNQIYMDGVETDVQTWNQTACLYYGIESEWPYCTPTNVPFYVGETIQKDAWGFMDSGAAGIFGFAPGSPIYGIINPLIGAQYQNFSLSVSNFTDWSFAQPNKTVAHHSSSYLAFGESQYVNMSGTNTSIIYTSSVYGAPGVFSVNEFGFGMLSGMNYSDVTNSTGVTQSFQSINNMNSFVYGTFTNQTVITPSFRGLGLPETPYNRFSNLLSIATQGSSNCNLDGLDWCLLPRSCDHYPNLWNYQFQVVLNNQLTTNGDSRTMYIPLATFANTNADSGNCRIYVEKLDPTQQQIVLGSMFFQSFFYEQIAANDTYFQVAIMRNFNALDNCFITTDVYPESKTSAFTVQEATPVTTADVANQPTLGAQIGGTLNNTATYTFDYTSDLTLVWASNCTTTKNTSCSDSPNNVQAMFTPTNTSSIWISSYTGISIGGYNTSGQIYSTDLCTTSLSECRLMNVYAADTLISNDWNSGVQGAWGILGYGARSPLWQSYINTNGIAQGSTVLMANTTTAAPKGLGAYYDANEVVFGGTGSLSTYDNNSSVIMTANMLGEIPVYDIKTFSFGAVYVSNNSAYFEDFNQTAQSVFTTNFQGLGLPTKLYSIYEQLLYTAGINYNVPVTCNNATDGTCSFTGTCAATSTMLNDLTFSVTFNSTTSNSFGNYVNIPLQAFAYQSGNNCVIDVTDLSGAQSSNVVFGAQFYQAFFVAQQSVYALTGGVDTLIGQDMQIFVSHDNAYATANITNTTFLIGPNPFTPVAPPSPTPTPSSSSVGWIIALVIVFLILAVFLGWAVYKWRSTQQEGVNVYEQNNSAGEQKLIHSSGNINEDDEDV